MDREKNILRVHGLLRCPVECSVCDGDHHWLDDCVEPDDPRFAEVQFEYKDQDGSAPILACKHCPAWADYPEWWGDTDDDGENVAFVAVDVRKEARRG